MAENTSLSIMNADAFPWVTVIMINYNGKHHLQTSLPRLMATRYPHFDVVLVDANSVDGSQEFLQNQWGSEPRISILLEKQSSGLGAAQNLATRTAKGELLVFLDNDARVTDGWLGPLVRAFQTNATIRAAQSKLVRDDLPRMIDGVGAFISPIGLLIDRARADKFRDVGQWEKPENIFSVKGAAMMFGKQALQEAGGFDPDFFLYNEEPDLCWRIWSLGYDVAYVPTSVVYHNSSGSIAPRRSELRYFHGTKNYLFMVLKNMPTRQLVVAIPCHVAVWTLTSLFLLRKGKKRDAISVIRGFFWVFSHSRLIMERRSKRMQASRREVPRSVVRTFTISYLIRTMKEYTIDDPKERSSYLQS